MFDGVLSFIYSDLCQDLKSKGYKFKPKKKRRKKWWDLWLSEMFQCLSISEKNWTVLKKFSVSSFGRVCCVFVSRFAPNKLAATWVRIVFIEDLPSNKPLETTFFCGFCGHAHNHSGCQMPISSNPLSTYKVAKNDAIDCFC